MKKIETIWQELESSATQGGGIVYRRYSANVVPRLFVAIRRADRNRCLALLFSDREASREVEKVAMKGLEFEVQTNAHFPNQYLLLIVLSDKRNEDVFATLAEDLIELVAQEPLEERVIHALHRRVLIWKSIFDDFTGNGLSLEAQLGLFGELTFLRALILDGRRPISDCLRSWVGPESGNRDFELGGWAVEVKSTRANQHQKVMISNERQLDNTHLIRLYLCSFGYDVQQGVLPTLNHLITELRSLFDQHPVEAMELERKLLLAGYLSKHANKYDEYAFLERSRLLFEVNDEFPSIRERDVPLGVGDVHYSIMLSAIAGFAVSMDQILA